MKSLFATNSRSLSGLGLGLSVGKLTTMMIDVLSAAPINVVPTKEGILLHLGPLGRLSKSRDINAAWTAAKRYVAREYPERFVLDGKVLRPAASMADRPRAKLSAAGHRRLTALAAKEGLTPDELLTQLLAAWRSAKK